MINEVTAATTFIALHLPRTVPESMREAFRNALAKQLHEKFESHWDPLLPLRGNGYRSLSLSSGRVDTVILDAAVECGIEVTILRSSLPADFVMWVDPFCVSCRAGEYGSVSVIWEDRAALDSIGCPKDLASALNGLLDSSTTSLCTTVPDSCSTPAAEHNEQDAGDQDEGQDVKHNQPTDLASPGSLSENGHKEKEGDKKVPDKKMPDKDPVSSLPSAILVA